MKTIQFKLMSVLVALCVISVSVYGQADWNTAGNTITGTDFLGTDGNSNQPLRLRTGTADPIVFQINGANEEMRLDASGNLGIGTTSPGYLLDVNGDINLTNETDFVRIAGEEVLYCSSSNYNLAVGALHDMSSITAGDRNLMVGKDNGLNLTTGMRNNLFGFQAGMNLTEGLNNTFLGECSGRASTIGNTNTFVGAYSGVVNTEGYGNTFIGKDAGRYNVKGSQNTFLGEQSGYNLTVGDKNLVGGYKAGKGLTSSNDNNKNVILGAESADGAGLNTASYLTLVGFNAEAANNLTNAGGIGANAFVTASNSLVLGSISGTNGATANTNVGIGTTAPNNRLEIKHGTSGLSGLRLTDLTTATAGASTGEVLTIDSNGDVILVRDSIGSGGTTADAWLLAGNGGTTAGVTNDFIGTTDEEDFVIATDDQEWMRVIGETTNQGHVGIHTITPSNGVLHVVDDDASSANTAIYGHVTNGTVSKAVEGYSYLTSGTAGYGGYFFADAGATGPTTNYGVYSEAAGASTDYAGYFTGDVYCTGSYLPSDRSLKTNVNSLDNGLDLVMRLSPKQYVYEANKFPQMKLPEGIQFGFIAQEFKSVVPTLTKHAIQPQVERDGVNHSDVDFTAVNYTGLIPILVDAIQEQQAMIEEKEERIAVLEQEVERLTVVEKEVDEIKNQLALILEQGSKPSATDVTVGFADNGSVNQQESTELYQNRPNPFRDITTFSYSLGNAGKVELSIYSMDGVFIETVANSFQEKGDYKVEWDSREIPNGMYFYILTVDGVEWVKKAIRLR